jgi:hypothetical protein
VDYRPGGLSAPHRHPASGFVFAYALSGTIRSQVEGEPLRVYRAGQSWIEPPNSQDALFPTTAAGAVAWLEYVANPGVPGDPDACFLTYRDTEVVAKQVRAVITALRTSA